MAGKLKQDLTGLRFGRLTVIERGENSLDNKPRWKCRCDCGNECLIYGSSLTSANTKSCGCLRREIGYEKNYTHGESKSRLYSVWNMMKQRCNDPNHKHYKNYGGRGISVCQEWEESYEKFRDWAIENGYDPKANRGETTIDRMDNNGNYCPENCRIADWKTQTRNTRRNHYLTYNGKTQTFGEWENETGIYRMTIRNRIKSGWSVEEALTIKPEIGRNQLWRMTK